MRPEESVKRVLGRSRKALRAGFFSFAVVLVLGGCATQPVETAEQTAVSAQALPPDVVEHALTLAEKALEDERNEDAQRIVDRVLLSDPNNPRAKLIQAENALAAGQHEVAAEQFTSLLGEPTVKAKAFQGRGLAFLMMDDKDRAKDDLEAALEADPKLWRAWNGLAFYYDLKADWPQSAKSYDEALAIKRNSALLYNNRGYSEILQGRFTAAVNDLSHALSLDPEMEVAQANLRLALAWDGKYAQATTGVTPENKGRVYNNIGFVALMRRDYGNAESYLLRAMEEDASYNQTARRNLALLHNLQDIPANEEADQARSATALSGALAGSEPVVPETFQPVQPVQPIQPLEPVRPVQPLQPVQPESAE